MKYELKEKLAPFLSFCRENRKIVGLICAAVALICLFQTVSAIGRSGNYIKDSSGTLTAIRVEDREEGLSIPLQIQAEQDGVKTKVDVILSFDGENVTAEPAEGSGQSAEEKLRSEIRALTRSLEGEEGTVISLPKSLPGGIRLSWSGSRTSSIPAILMLIPLSLAAMYQNQREKEKAKERRRTDGIRKELPGFNSQLLLLLNSGLIFNDAFSRIAEGYEKRSDAGPLGEIVLDIRRQSEETGSSLVSLLSGISKTVGVREFSRMAGIIADNQYKGVNLTDKLESESDLLWNQRKKLAEERGRTAETKLAFPLALLLLVLIMVTAGPAILQV